jgi:hypothetical protein
MNGAAYESAWLLMASIQAHLSREFLAFHFLFFLL